MELVNSNIVIATPQLMPITMTQMLVVKRGIAREDEFEAGCIYSDQLCQIITNQFNLFISPGLLQLTPKPPMDCKGDWISEKIRLLVDPFQLTLPGSMGVNFNWHEIREEQATIELARRLFFRKEVSLFKKFDVSGARFGGYLSRDFEMARMKLDIKPIEKKKSPADDPHEYGIQFSFNFHKDVWGDNIVEDIHRMSSIWDKAKQESESTVADALVGGD